jgi:ABC-2 type transport system ATP-binding protein
MPEAVSLQGLTRRFGDFVAVAGLDLEVAQGEIFGFLGPNGAGKSTTIKMLCGLLPPSDGTGRVAGHDIRTEGQAIKASIGYMSQRFSLYDDLRVGENLSFFGQAYGLAGKRLAERQAAVLDLVGLANEPATLTGDLAPGRKQRLALACALLHEPRILFLDEPTSGTDPLGRRRFWDLIHMLAGQGVTVFVTTHYMEEAEYCDRLALIYRGELIAAGTPAELKSTRMTDAILDIQCSSPQDVMEEIAALPSIREVALFGRGLHAVVARGDEAAAIAALSGRFDARVTPISPTMEDVFVSLIEARDRQ